MYFWKYILAKKAGLSQKKCNMALYGLPVLPIAEAFEKTVTGNPISVTDALAQDALSLQVSFTPTQDGTPSIDSEPTTEPYLSKVIPRGNKEYYSLVGATVAWNQLVQNGDFADTTKWSAYNSSKISLTIANGMASISVLESGAGGYNYGIRQQNVTPTISGHKYLLRLFARTSYVANYMLMDFDGSGKTLRTTDTASANKWIEFFTITNASVGGRTSIIAEPANSVDIGDTIDYKNVQIIDLTQMFANNPAIADYAYSLEQSEAGSGIAWLKSYGFFTKDYYAYNPGELISVNTSGHKVGSTTYPIDNIDLRGLFKLSNGKLYCEGDTYKSDEMVTRRYGIVDLGTLSWYYNRGDNSRLQITTRLNNVKAPSLNTEIGNIICKQYENTIYDNVYNHSRDKIISLFTNGLIYVYDTVYSDAETFKTAMSGVYLVYELKTPTTESATAYTSPIDVETGGTEEFIDSRTVPIPVGNETVYASEYEIHGKTGVTVSHGATQDDPNPTEHEVEFTSQGTVYGGTVDIVSGELSVTWGYIASYNGETLTGIWMSSKDVYAEGTTPSTGAEVAYELATPLTYQLTTQQVQMLLGNNYLETEDGTITLTYMAGK